MAHLKSEEELEIKLEEQKQWDAEQPEFIAVKMTNKEMTSENILIGHASMRERTETYFIPAQELPKRVYRIINGELYKKVKNPKLWGIPVIPW